MTGPALCLLSARLVTAELAHAEMQCKALLMLTLCVQGLRTLVLTTRVLDEQMYQEWNRSYEHAASSLEDREARIAAVSEKIGEHSVLISAPDAFLPCRGWHQTCRWAAVPNDTKLPLGCISCCA